MGQTEEDARQVVVNLGKHEDQELIYLLPTIGGRIQPHQKDGLRFLWRELIEDHASKQGALLAQTMGLGKTMQVISFLVTVAGAAKSTNANIRNQIPDRLRESKTLVLCPPSLVENWYDEFLLWAPNDMATSIGEVRTVLSGMLLEDRLQTIRDWDEDGGVLVLGSSLLRELVINPTRKVQGRPMLDEDVHAETKDVLLNGPNIVVCDEAHAAKSQSSQLNKILAQFKSTSRIALTGSPLCNNLSEYYALIEWIAPGYLGDHPEFVYKYKEPIEQGLYRDSNESEWRKGLKKLELFKREVQPKVHRADNSVLASRLQGKSEFVVKVALTELQQKLYRTFVDSMKERLEYDEGVAKQARLWAWVSKLRLVCNHPCCFHDYLSGRDAPKPRTKRRKPVKMSALDDVKSDDEDGADGSPTELGMPEHVVRKLLGVFNGLPTPLESVHLAYKMTMLLKIIELCHVAKDKILVFSHSLRTLDYVERVLQKHDKEYRRMDGKVPTQRRQAMTKEFNRGTSHDVFLISTRAGGTGLNLFGANRVVILDDHFNPTWEEQAIGRAYRIGQVKHVYVYRLTAGGTFEEALHNQTLFKQQLATRAVDQRHIARLATRDMQDYFRHCQAVEQMDLDPFKGKDPDVLDHILASQSSDPFIRSIVPCETFRQEIDEKLTAEEQKEVEEEEANSRLRRNDPVAYQAKMMAKTAVDSRIHGPPITTGVFYPNTANSFNPVDFGHAVPVDGPTSIPPQPPTNPTSTGQPVTPVHAVPASQTAQPTYPEINQEHARYNMQKGSIPAVGAGKPAPSAVSGSKRASKYGGDGAQEDLSPTPPAFEDGPAPIDSDSSPRRTFAKYPKLQGLLDQEARRVGKQ
ncbi:MAG: hypothetical protein Q9183_003830 [Haloplaca sp. 2 TL-2023]